MYLRGALDAAGANAISDHIAACPACKSKLAALKSEAGSGAEHAATRAEATKYFDGAALSESPEGDRGAGRELPDGQPDEPSRHQNSVPSTVGRSLSDTAEHVPAADGLPDGSDSSSAALPRIPGYDVLKFIARGGMGVVVQARHQVLNRMAAIKVPRAGELSEESDRQRFLQEARAAARLTHANICPIYEVGEAQGLPFLAMAYIEGVTLDRWANEANPNARQIAEVMALLSRAAAYAHDNDILHRDLKPGNVMIDGEFGQPMLMDFGLAKQLERGDDEASLTMAGQVDRIGTHTDVYALGAILYYLICRQTPFTGSLSEVLNNVQNGEPPRPSRLVPRVHRDLETICLRAMAKDPASRYSSALRLAEDLERFCAGEPIEARREGILGRTVRRARRRPAMAGFVVLTLGLTMALTLLGWRSLRTAELARLRGQFTDQLDLQDWTPGHVRELENRIREVGKIDPPTEAEMNALLRRRLAEHIEELTRSPRLTESIQARIESEIGVMRGLDASRATSLRRAFQRRMRDWEPVFRLLAPIESTDDVFAAKAVRLVDGVIHGTSPRLITHIRSAGKVRLEATFADGWEQVNVLAVCLGLQGPNPADQGYRFEIHAGSTNSNKRDPTSFAAERKGDGTIKARILRNGLLLREDDIPVPAVPLRLTAAREVQRLTFQINDLPPFEFYDPFPVADHDDRVFAVIAAPEVGLSALSASRQPLAPEASPLEVGDELFLAGQPSEALIEYERQAVLSGDSDVAQEARCKQAQCLASLQRFSEARPILESLSQEDGRQWPALAHCLLWEMYLKESGPDAAYGVFENIVVNYPPAELRSFVPAHVIQGNVFAYREDAAGLNLLEYNPQRVSNVRRAIRIHDFFGIRNMAYYESQLYLGRALCMEGEYDEASVVMARLVKTLPEVTPANRQRWFQMWETYGWVMRMQDRAAVALAAFDRRLFRPDRTLREEYDVLLIERARLQMHLGRVEAAASDLEPFLAGAGPNMLEYEYWSGAHLVHGFVLEQLGRNDAALAAWRAGLPTPPYDWLRIRRIEGLLNGLVLASLTGGMTEQEMGALTDRVIDKLSRMFNRVLIEATLGMLLEDFSPEVMSRISHRVFLGPERRELARQIALRELPVLEMMQKTFGCLAAASADELLIDGEMSSAQHQLMLELGEALFDHYYTGELTRTQVLQFGLAWKGFPGLGGWQSLAPALQPAVRGPLAYGLGLRYLKRQKTAAAKNFFETALADAPDDSPLAGLATAELQQLSKAVDD